MGARGRCGAACVDFAAVSDVSRARGVAMRRLAVVSLAPMVTAVLALTGCESGGSGSTSAAGASSGAGASPSASARPAHSISPGARKACDLINKAIADGAAGFGTDLGNVAGHLAGGNKAQADQAKTDALKRLKDLAAKIRTI